MGWVAVSQQHKVENQPLVTFTRFIFISCSTHSLFRACDSPAVYYYYYYYFLSFISKSSSQHSSSQQALPGFNLRSPTPPFLTFFLHLQLSHLYFFRHLHILDPFHNPNKRRFSFTRAVTSSFHHSLYVLQFPSFLHRPPPLPQVDIPSDLPHTFDITRLIHH